MSKSFLGILAAALLLAACSSGTPGGGGSTPATGAGGGGGGSTPSTGAGGGGGNAGGTPTSPAGGGAAGLADAAAALTDVCNVMPKDTIRAAVPDAGDPVFDSAYRQCTMSNATTSVQITVSAGFGEPDPPSPGESIADLGQKAWLQEQTPDDAYLVIFLGVAGSGAYETMYVEWAGHDGKAHREDAIGVARAVIQALA
jgi:hypothetical protein